SILEELPKQFDEDFGKFKGLIIFVERVRKQHYNATGHNIGRTYGSFGSDELAPGHHHGKSLIETLEISCDACGNESPQSERRDYPIHVLLHDRGQWEVCTGQSDCECQGYEGKGVRIGVNLSPERMGKGKDPSPTGSKLDLKLRSGPDLAAHLSNEGVPFGELGKISQYLPDSLCRGFNLYLCRDLFHV